MITFSTFDAQIPLNNSAPEDIPVSTWQPSESVCVKANVLILHGMAEHHRRYEGIANFLTRQGIRVFAYDHRGHGHSLRSAQLGDFGRPDGFRLAAHDAVRVLEAISIQYPEEPLFLMGHSMGSFIAQRALFNLKVPLAGVILSGSTLQKPIMMHLGRGVAFLELMRKGELATSSLIDKLTFGAFNQDFKPCRTSFDWLSRDEEQVDRYIQDPYCGFSCSIRFWFDFFSGLLETYSSSNRKQISSRLPFYLFGGSQDPVGKNKGLVKLAEELKKHVGVQDVICMLYPGARHETLNETNREDVYRDLAGWILAR